MAFIYTVGKIKKVLLDDEHHGYEVEVKCEDGVKETATFCRLTLDKKDFSKFPPTNAKLQSAIEAEMIVKQDSGTTRKQDCESALKAAASPTFSKEKYEPLDGAALTV